MSKYKDSVLIFIKQDPLLDDLVSEAVKDDRVLKKVLDLESVLVCEWVGGMIISHLSDEELELLYEAKCE